MLKGKVPGRAYRAGLQAREDLRAEASVKTENGDTKSGRFTKEQGQGVAQEQLGGAQRYVFSFCIFALSFVKCSSVWEGTSRITGMRTGWASGYCPICQSLYGLMQIPSR